MQINPYLNFDGNCEEAFKFYAKSFNRTIDMMLPREGTPVEMHVSAEWRNKIMHASMRVGETVIMGSDVPADRYHLPAGFSVAIQVATPEEAETVFQALQEGASVNAPLQQTFFAARFGMLVDRFGIPWMINCPPA